MAALALAWAVLALALHLAGAQEHVAVLAGSRTTTLAAVLGVATVATRLVGVFVVGPALIASLLGAGVDHLIRRRDLPSSRTRTPRTGTSGP
jgi:hypothetical protein